jgi:hypothetical protein
VQECRSGRVNGCSGVLCKDWEWRVCRRRR